MPTNYIEIENVCIKFEPYATDDLEQMITRTQSRLEALPPLIIDRLVGLADKALHLVGTLPIGELVEDATRAIVSKILHLVDKAVRLAEYLPKYVFNLLTFLMNWGVPGAVLPMLPVLAGVITPVAGAGMALFIGAVKNLFFKFFKSLKIRSKSVWALQTYNHLRDIDNDKFYDEILTKGRVVTPKFLRDEYGIDTLFGFLYADKTTNRTTKGGLRYYPVIVPIRQIGFTWCQVQTTPRCLNNLEEVVSLEDPELVVGSDGPDHTTKKGRIVRCLEHFVHERLCEKLASASDHGAKKELTLDLDAILAICAGSDLVELADAGTFLTDRSFVRIGELAYRTFDDEDVVTLRRPRLGRTWERIDAAAVPVDGLLWEKISLNEVQLKETLRFIDLMAASGDVAQTDLVYDPSEETMWPPVAHRVPNNAKLLGFLTRNTIKGRCAMTPDQWKSFGINNLRIDSYVDDAENNKTLYRPVSHALRRLDDPQRFLDILQMTRPRGNVYTLREPISSTEGIDSQSIVYTQGRKSQENPIRPGYFRAVTLKAASAKVDFAQIERLVAEGGDDLAGLRPIVKQWKLFTSHIEYTRHVAMREANGSLPLISPATTQITVTDTGRVSVAIPGLVWTETPNTSSLSTSDQITGPLVDKITNRRQTEFSHNEAWKQSLRWSNYPPEPDADCRVPTKWKSISRPSYSQHRVTRFPRLAKFLQHKLRKLQGANSTPVAGGSRFDVTEEEWHAHEATSLLWRVDLVNPRYPSEMDHPLPASGMHVTSIDDEAEERRGREHIAALQSESVVLHVNENELVLRDIIDDPTTASAMVGRLKQRGAKGVVRQTQYLRGYDVWFLCADDRMMEWMVIGDFALTKLKEEFRLKKKTLLAELQSKLAKADKRDALKIQMKAVAEQERRLYAELCNTLTTRRDRPLFIADNATQTVKPPPFLSRESTIYYDAEEEPKPASRKSSVYYDAMDHAEEQASPSGAVGADRRYQRLQALRSEMADLQQKMGFELEQIKDEERMSQLEEELAVMEIQYVECGDDHLEEAKRDALVELLHQRLDAIRLPCAADFQVDRHSCIETSDGLLLRPVVIEPSTRFYLAHPATPAARRPTGLRWIKTNDDVNPPNQQAEIKRAIRDVPLGTNWEEIDPAVGQASAWVHVDDAFCSHRFGAAQFGNVTTLGSVYPFPHLRRWSGEWSPNDFVQSRGRYFKPVKSPVRIPLRVVRDTLQPQGLLFTHVVEVDGERFKPAPPLDARGDDDANEDYFVLDCDAFGDDHDYRFAPMSGEETPVVRLRSQNSIDRFNQGRADSSTPYETFCDILKQPILYNTIVELPSGDKFRPKGIESCLRDTSWLEEEHTSSSRFGGDEAPAWLANSKNVEFAAMWGHRGVAWTDETGKSSQIPPPGTYNVKYVEYAINGRVYIQNYWGPTYSFANTSELAIHMAQESARIQVESSTYLSSIAEFVREAQAARGPRDIQASLENLKKRDPRSFQEIQTGTIADKLRFYREQSNTDELENAISGGADLNQMLWKKSFSNCASLEGKVTMRRAAVEESVDHLNELLRHMDITINKMDSRVNEPMKIDQKIQDFADAKLEILQREMQTLAQFTEIERRVQKFHAAVRSDIVVPVWNPNVEEYTEEELVQAARERIDSKR